MDASWKSTVQLLKFATSDLGNWFEFQQPCDYFGEFSPGPAQLQTSLQNAATLCSKRPFPWLQEHTLTRERYSTAAERRVEDHFLTAASHTQQWTPLRPEYTHSLCWMPKSSARAEEKQKNTLFRLPRKQTNKQTKLKAIKFYIYRYFVQYNLWLKLWQFVNNDLL